MKHNKLFAMLAMAVALTLAACGGGSGSKSSGKASSGGSGKTPTSSSSKKPAEPTKRVSLSEAKIEKGTDNKVYLVLNGSYDLYEAGEIKFAWGAGISGQEYAYGSESPADADFKADGVTMDAATKKFEAKLALTDLQFTAGNYAFYAGTKEDTGFAYGEALEMNYEFGNLSDGTYRYYPRSDVSAVAIEVMPPITYTVAEIVTSAPGDHTGKFLKLGGAKNATVTAEAVAAWQPYADFEPVPWASAVRINFSGDNQNGFFEINGDNFFFYLDVTGLSQGTNYLLHLNHNGAKANLFMANSIADTPYRFETDNVIYTIYANPDAGQAGGEAEFYGCLAVKVAYVNEPAEQS